MECSLLPKNFSASATERRFLELGPALLFMCFTIPSVNKDTAQYVYVAAIRPVRDCAEHLRRFSMTFQEHL